MADTPNGSKKREAVSPPSLPGASSSSPEAITGVVLKAGESKVDVFAFTNYRDYLHSFYEHKHSKNPAYSMATFIRRAGLGENSRGYLKLVIEGKRSLTSNTVRRFIDALGLAGREALYFENLVFFNQAKNAKDKDYYFHRLKVAASTTKSKQFEMLQDHYQYCTHWHYVAIRELVGLMSFQEDTTWIANQLRGKITRKQAQDALDCLIRMEFVRRDESGKLVQSEPLVKYPGGSFNEVYHKFHLEMIERAKESLENDPYVERNASGVTLSCDYSKLPEIKKAINAFRDELCLKFGVGSENPDTVFQVNVQFFQLTPLKIRRDVK